MYDISITTKPRTPLLPLSITLRLLWYVSSFLIQFLGTIKQIQLDTTHIHIIQLHDRLHWYAHLTERVWAEKKNEQSHNMLRFLPFIHNPLHILIFVLCMYFDRNKRNIWFHHLRLCYRWYVHIRRFIWGNHNINIYIGHMFAIFTSAVCCCSTSERAGAG